MSGLRHRKTVRRADRLSEWKLLGRHVSALALAQRLGMRERVGVSERQLRGQCLLQHSL